MPDTNEAIKAVYAGEGAVATMPVDGVGKVEVWIIPACWANHFMETLEVFSDQDSWVDTLQEARVEAVKKIGSDRS